MAGHVWRLFCVVDADRRFMHVEVRATCKPATHDHRAGRASLCLLGDARRPVCHTRVRTALRRPTVAATCGLRCCNIRPCARTRPANKCSGLRWVAQLEWQPRVATFLRTVRGLWLCLQRCVLAVWLPDLCRVHRAVHRGRTYCDAFP